MRLFPKLDTSKTSYVLIAVLLILYIAAIALILFSFIGWVLNIQNIFQYMPKEIIEASVIWILSILGIFFPPLGAIMGWFY